MGVVVATVRVAANTATGTQNITTSDLGGLTPKAALIIGSVAVTDATAAAHNVVSYGACSGATNEWVTAVSDTDNVADSDNDTWFDDDFCVLFVNPGAQTVDGSAEFSAFIADGVTINWTDAPAGAYFLTVVFFAGTDLTAVAGSHTTSGVLDATEDITTLGTAADVVIGAGCVLLVDTDSNVTQYGMSLGLAHITGAGVVTQRSMVLAYNIAAAAAVDNAFYDDSYWLVRTNFNGTGTPRWALELSQHASGFSITQRIEGFVKPVGYLALDFGGVVNAWVGTVTTPTATGNDVETGPGFKPQAVIMNMNGTEADATLYTDLRAGIYGVSVITATAQYSTSWASEDAAATMNTQSLSNDQAVDLPDHTGAAFMAATYVSFDSTGFTLNYSATHTTAKLWPTLAIQEVSATAVKDIIQPGIIPFAR